ncbi:MAG: hypothetical protein ACM30H_03635 [Clostridia bacterium]
MKLSRSRVLLFLCVAASATAAAQSIPEGGSYGRDRQLDRPSRPERADRSAKARERCKADRGVDCDSAKGLQEWELLERSRQEALRAGSRHLAPARRTP